MNERQEAIYVAARIIKSASIEGVDVSDILLLARQFLKADEHIADMATMEAYPAMSSEADAAGGFGLASLKNYPI